MNTAFGDSITYGTGASAPANAWRALLASAWGVSITNNGVSGTMALDATASVMATSGTTGDKFTLMFGTNDERIYGVSATKLSYSVGALSSHIAWLATGNRFLGQSASITYSAGWTNLSIYGGAAAKRSDQNGATATFSVTGDVLYLSTIGQDVATGTFTITVGGTVYGPYTTAAPTINTANGASYGAQLIRIAGLGAGSHTAVLTVTSATGGNNAVYILWAGYPSAGAKVYVSNVIRQSAAGYTANGGSDANVSTYNSAYSAAVSQFAGDGLDVVLVDNWSIIDPTTMLADGCHPNDLGHEMIVYSRTLRSVW